MAAVGAVGVCALATRAAADETPAVVFRWNAPASCPSSADVEARIRRRIEAPRRSSRIDARLTEEGGEQVVVVAIDGVERTLRAPSCAAAADAVAVIVALALDANARREVDAGTSEPAALQPDASPSDASVGAVPDSADASLLAAPSPPDAAAKDDRLRDGDANGRAVPAPMDRYAALALGAVVDTSTLPHVSPGIVIGGELRRSVFAGRLATTWLLPQTVRGTSGDLAYSAAIFAADLEATGCAVTSAIGWADFAGCLGVGIGVMHGASDGVSAPGSGFGPRFQGHFGARVAIPIGARLALAVGAFGIADPARSPFRIEGIGDIYRPPPLAFRGNAGLEWRFP